MTKLRGFLPTKATTFGAAEEFEGAAFVGHPFVAMVPTIPSIDSSFR